MASSIQLAVLILSVVVTCSCETFYIVPVNSTERCEAEPCLTLDQLDGEITNQNFSNLTLYFLPGKHKSQCCISFSKIKNIRMISLDSTAIVEKTTIRISAEILEIGNIAFGLFGTVNIDSCRNVLLKGCTFKGYELQINSDSTTMTDCKISGGRDYKYRESIVRVITNDLNIIYCTFNSGTVKVFTYGYIVNITYQVYINDSTFYQDGSLSIEQARGNIYITNCMFKESDAGFVEIMMASKIIIINSTASHNAAKSEGPVIFLLQGSYLEIANCIFIDNVNYISIIEVRVPTKQLHIINSTFIDNKCLQTFQLGDIDSLYVNDSTFINNKATVGGALSTSCSVNTLIIINNCKFIANNATFGAGGAIYSCTTNSIAIIDSIFTSNTADGGGAIYVIGYFIIVNCIFTNNYTPQKEAGAAILVQSPGEQLTDTPILRHTIFTGNNGGGVVAIFGVRIKIENASFRHNEQNTNFNLYEGCIYLFNSKVDMIGPVIITDNIGGGIRAIQSQIHINSSGDTVINNNTASLGGGIMLRESELVIQSPVIISQNKAEQFGGGIYAYQSVIHFTSERDIVRSFIINNTVNQSGGGVCAMASSIKLTHSYVTIDSNTAQLSGGGLYLQQNSKIYLMKQKQDIKNELLKVRLKVTSNFAVYGGGIYVDDNSTAGSLQCQGAGSYTADSAYATPECFIQTIKLYQDIRESNILINTFLINNTAELGSALYGGLLDRCTVSSQAEASDDVKKALQYIITTVMFSSDSTLTSDPVQVVLCGKHNNSFIETTKGNAFKMNVSAIDQVGNLVNATIYSSVITESGVDRLKEGQAEQRVGNQCTELEYNVFSQDSSAQVELYADGPCSNMGISKQTFTITFLPCTCPIGLQPSQSQIECVCVCDQELQPHQITNCSQQAGTIQLETNIWIGVANSTNGTGYIIHDCPFDYCVEKPVNISLNSSQERNRQCAFNRSGILCGQCQQGLSLVLATSNCVKCLNHYLVLLIPFALAGIALVGFLLFFNFTLATGSVHGLIFYSNLLPVNYFTQPSALTVFISWVNLDLGIETCFYNGMSSQAKVLLQLAFPAYLFLLMFLIIILCRYSNFFATLLSKRNPVAALCTLIFMSYSKLLQFIIAALQSTVLEFPDSSKQRVWLYDGNVQYSTPSRTPHFLAAAIIVTAGGLFTLQLSFSQWFPHCSKWKFMKWTRNTKYTGLMDAYHAPFTHKHRYWMGLLLFALIIHNSLSSMTADIFLPILLMGCIGIGLLMFKLCYSKVYKSWINNHLENVFLLNLVFLAFGTLYAQASERKNIDTILGNVSMSISACLFLVIISYHSYKYVYLQSRFYRRHKTHIRKIVETFKENLGRGPKGQEMEELVTDQGGTLETHYTAMRSHRQREPDLDVLAPITTDDYRPAPPPHNAHPEVTHAVVEITQ